MKSSGIGGQAVFEGVMMKNGNQYAIAVRKPDKEIAVEVKEFHKLSDRFSLLKLPVLRGVVAFAESMVLGVRTLTYSAEFFEEEDAEQTEKKKVKKESGKGLQQETKDTLVMSVTVLLSVILAIGIFFVVPYFLSQLLVKVITSPFILALLEGVIRILLFIGYVLAISHMNDIRRVFMYHGAEHKTINCVETGNELTVANVKLASKEHKRCGTSFLLYVMVISALFFMFIRFENMWLRLLVRLLLIPVVAGVSYEFIRLAGSSDNAVVRVLSKPGLLLQRLTTKEPDSKMIEVAIASVEAVFDWRAYLQQNGIAVSAPPEQTDSAAALEQSLAVGKDGKAATQKKGKKQRERTQEKVTQRESGQMAQQRKSASTDTDVRENQRAKAEIDEQEKQQAKAAAEKRERQHVKAVAEEQERQRAKAAAEEQKKAEDERAAIEKAAAEKKQAHAELLAKEQAEAERVRAEQRVQEKAKAERLAREKEEAERAAQEKALAEQKALEEARQRAKQAKAEREARFRSTPIPTVNAAQESEEDDEILRALDRFFVFQKDE